MNWLKKDRRKITLEEAEIEIVVRTDSGLLCSLLADYLQEMIEEDFQDYRPQYPYPN